jgi:mannan polymerase II complex ANP1 subunit
MAKKMEYSVVGLPHYTIWHLYEPSVDDIKHMEVWKDDSTTTRQGGALSKEPVSNSLTLPLGSQEMERERIAREAEEKEKAEKAQKMKDAFGDPNGQWEKDKAAIQDLANGEKKESTDKSKSDGKAKSEGKAKSDGKTKGGGKTAKETEDDTKPVKKQQ